ncbi:MAG: Rrf2 family transcriptional regulator [Acidimicrobiia bacterium]
MRLELTRKTDLATRAMLDLDREARRLKASVLAEHIGTTPGFLSQVMTPLVAHGWVDSEPGPTGGYELCADLEQVMVLDLIEAVEGVTDASRCVLEDRNCDRTGPCALHHPWSRARHQLLDELAATALSSLR